MRIASSGLRHRPPKAREGEGILARRRASRFSHTRNTPSLLFGTPAMQTTLFLDFLKVLYFFLVGYAILKDLSYLLARHSQVKNSTGDIMTIDR